MITVSDSSPIIALSRINKLNLLQSLYKEILIPEAVAKEVFSSASGKRIALNKLPWIKIKSLSQPLSANVLSLTLGQGESEAIGLTLELKANLIILDELAARNIVVMFGLKFTGTLGILLKAKEKHLLLSVKECLDNLIKHEFRLSASLYNDILELAGEK